MRPAPYCELQSPEEGVRPAFLCSLPFFPLSSKVQQAGFIYLHLSKRQRRDTLSEAPSNALQLPPLQTQRFSLVQRRGCCCPLVTSTVN